MPDHSISYRVYYEDTDAGGVVYYANYLKYAERARTEMLREAGINQSEQNILFVVKHVEADLIFPARLDDMLEVKTSIKKLGGASLKMEQVICKDTQDIAIVKVVVVCIDKEFKPTRLPKEIREKLGK